jgi:hypothetical protein
MIVIPLVSVVVLSAVIVAIENGDDIIYDSLCGMCYVREGGDI